MYRLFNLICSWLLAIYALTYIPLSCATNSQVSPSFNCHHAKTVTEKTICADEQLAADDKKVVSAWYLLMENSLDAGDRVGLKKMKDSQKVWLQQREQCLADKVCLQQRMRERLEQIHSKMANN
jgi:uncharacterized protein